MATRGHTPVATRGHTLVATWLLSRHYDSWLPTYQPSYQPALLPVWPGGNEFLLEAATAAITSSPSFGPTYPPGPPAAPLPASSPAPPPACGLSLPGVWEGAGLVRLLADPGRARACEARMTELAPQLGGLAVRGGRDRAGATARGPGSKGG